MSKIPATWKSQLGTSQITGKAIKVCKELPKYCTKSVSKPTISHVRVPKDVFHDPGQSYPLDTELPPES